MKKLQSDCVSWLVLLTGAAQLLLVCGEGVYLSLGSTLFTTNNTEILITDIGDDAEDGLPSLICQTNLTECCMSGADNSGSGDMGQWTYPDGSMVLNNVQSQADYALYIVRNTSPVIKLARRASINPPPLSPTGSYCCIIPTNGGEMTFCANLVVCLSLPPLNNGAVSYSNLTLGLFTVATYTCESGYSLDRGSTTRICLSNGTWSGFNPVCQPACSDVALTINGDIVYTDGSTDNRPVGTVATYTCNTGYTPTGGSLFRFCMTGGKWSESAPTCQEITCSDQTNPTKGMIDYNMGTVSSRPVDTVATYTCDTGYTLNGNTTRTCGSDGVWSGSAPTCLQKLICSDLTLTNGYVTYGGDRSPDNRPVKTVALYNCNPGYTLVLTGGSSLRVCMSGGIWSGSTPTCQDTGPTDPPPTSCSDLTNPTNALIGYNMGTASLRPFDTVATYTCNTGYTLNGDTTTRVCVIGGFWSGSPPTCEGLIVQTVECPPLPAIINGMISYSPDVISDYDLGTEATYTCEVGFYLEGSEVRVCMDDDRMDAIGVWSRPEPICVPIQCPPLDTITNGFITYAPDTTHNYDLGTVATYACDTGFIMDLSPGGSLSRTCVDDLNNDVEGVFNGQALTCIAIVCSPLPTITNGTISYSADVTPDYDLGTEATYTCEAGFYINITEANQVRRCVDDDEIDAIGGWSGQEPSCDLIVCPRLLVPPYTSITYSPRTSSPFPIGAHATYTINCPKSMERNGGNDVRTCTSDDISAVGVWSGTAPNCTAQKVYISHGNTHYYANNTTIIVSSIMETNDTSLTCHTDSTTCCRGKDKVPSSNMGTGEWLFPNGTSISQNRVTGSSTSGFYWSRDYQVLRLYRQGDTRTPLGTYCCRLPDSGGEMRTFCANLVATRCHLLTAPNNGNVTYSKKLQNDMYIFGTVATYTCSPGYGLNSNEGRTCISDTGGGTIGAFSGNTPSCDRIMCSILPSSTNWTINYPSGTTAPYDYGTRATYQCNYGHRLASGDSEERTCTGDGSTPSGQWDGTAPQCPPVDCGTPPSIINASLGIPTTTTFTGTVTYSCNDGYALFGIATSICQANATWSRLPECREPMASVVGIVAGIVILVVALLIIGAVILIVVRARRSGKHTFSGLKFGVGRVTRKSLFTVKIDPLNPLDIPLDDHIGTLTPDANMYVGVTTSSFSKERGRENTQVSGIGQNSSFYTTDFPAHVDTMHEDTDKLFETEYTSISKEPQSPNNESKLPHNTTKNRFGNVFPYDFNRVKLKPVKDIIGSDYINASYVYGYMANTKYIAAQGPLPNTLEDFWKMIFENKLQTIVMLTRCFEERKKCECYWPLKDDQPLEMGCGIVVSLTSTVAFPDFTVRKMKVNQPTLGSSPVFEVTLFHYTSWPDHGVPSSGMSLIYFTRAVRKTHPQDDPRPLLVHCSAGVGRTGTFIVLDTMLDRMEQDGMIHIYDCVTHIRKQRVLLVQTLSQYIFLHDALKELIVCGETEIPAHALMTTVNQLKEPAAADEDTPTDFQRQFKILSEFSGLDGTEDYYSSQNEENEDKNRYSQILPNEMHRVQLQFSPSGSNYINASYIHGYQQRRGYIATQGPLEHTTGDLWRMVVENECSCIVMLCALSEEEQEVCHRYWPKFQGEAGTYDDFTVTQQTFDAYGDYVVRKLSVAMAASDEPPCVVTQFHITRWTEKDPPQNPAAILDVVQEVNAVQMASGNKPIVVMCNNGIGRTGVFITLHAQLERLKIEGVVDLFQFIKFARKQREGLVSSPEMYAFCHEALADYVDSFEAYANFKELV